MTNTPTTNWTTTRRGFLKGTLATTSLLATGLTIPGFLARTAHASTLGGSNLGADEKILVVVQLTGGNDGLNTVIPYGDDLYHKARPTLRVDAGRVHKLSGGGSGLGLHPAMDGMKGLYDAGMLSVVTNVGYPNPDRSHFKSMDIWHSCHTEPSMDEDGWLGRVVDAIAVEGQMPPALMLDDAPMPLALRSKIRPVPAVRALDALRLEGMTESVQRAMSEARRAASEDLLFVQRTAVSSCTSAKRLEEVARVREGRGVYPNSGLADRLRQIETLIAAKFNTRVYYTSLQGFDTHSKQALVHEPLLRELSDAVAAFYKSLAARGLADRVLLMTFSEFGRRVAENGSQGTDHGAGAPMFIAGPGCKGGVLGKAPDLAHQTEGDVPHQMDFRRVYAGVLKDWLGVKPEGTVGAGFAAAEIVRK